MYRAIVLMMQGGYPGGKDVVLDNLKSWEVEGGVLIFSPAKGGSVVFPLSSVYYFDFFIPEVPHVDKT